MYIINTYSYGIQILHSRLRIRDGGLKFTMAMPNTKKLPPSGRSRKRILSSVWTGTGSSWPPCFGW